MLAESNRVEAFSDGVLAIAITLLVLDLHTGEHAGQVGRDLLRQWPTYLAYVASFLYIGVVWVNHHSLFTRIARVDGGLLWCNPGPAADGLGAAVPDGRTCLRDGAGGHSRRQGQRSPALRRGQRGHGPELADHLRLPAAASAVALPGRDRGLLPVRAAPGRGRIFAAFVPVLVGLVAPLAALGFVVVMPVFYAATAEGLRSRRAAARIRHGRLRRAAWS